MANNLTPDDWAKSRWDIPYFAEKFLGIKTHPGQNAFFEKIIARTDTRWWIAAYLTIAASTGNRAGKTLAMAIAILHSCVFKMNQRPPDYKDDNSVRAWMRAPYDWYHFGIQQEVAELVYHELVKIFESRHEAQRGMSCPLIEEYGESIVQWDRKERGEYVWIRLSEMIGGAEIHFRSTTERALGTLGKAMHGISMDECGFETNLIFLINEVFHMRRLSTGGQLFLISTPSEGFTQFTDEWEKGNPENPARMPGHMSLRFSTRDNVGYGIDAGMFAALVAAMPPELVPQNIDGYFLQGSKSFFNSAAVNAAFVEEPADEWPEWQKPEKDHRYIQGLDPAITHDGIDSIVIDTTDKDHLRGVSMKELKGKQTVIAVVGMAHEQHGTYSLSGAKCTTGVDVTGFGGKVMRDQLSGIPGLKGVEFGGTAKVKLKLLMDLKGVIEKGQIKFPRRGIWLKLRRQLLAYRLSDARLDTDAVMALAIAVKLALRQPKDASASVPFHYFEPEAPQPKTENEKFWADLRRRGTTQRLGSTL